MMEKEKLPSSNSTAEKMFTVLEALAFHSDPVRLIDLAHELGMNQSTTYRFVTAMVNRGYAMQYGDTDRYAMTLKICKLAGSVQSQYSLVTMLHDFVVEASQTLRESAHLSKRENDSLVYIDNAAETTQILSIRQYIGKVAPLYCTGAGKLFLAESSEEDLDALLSRIEMKRYTEHTIVTKEALLDELARIRKCGYALDNEECEIGVRCVAVPVYDFTGKIAAVISVSGPSTRLTEKELPKISQQLLDISKRASVIMGNERNQQA